MRSTRVVRHISAQAESIYAALLDRDAIATWRVPEGMTSEVHEFDARVGGRFRISLSYDDATAAGKSSTHTDTYHGHFAELVPNERVVEVTEFETQDPALQGEMTMTTTLRPTDGGTEVAMQHDGLPPGVPVADNDTGIRMALDNLARLVEPEQH